jgi:hypothetical protein
MESKPIASIASLAPVRLLPGCAPLQPGRSALPGRIVSRLTLDFKRLGRFFD